MRSLVLVLLATCGACGAKPPTVDEPVHEPGTLATQGSGEELPVAQAKAISDAIVHVYEALTVKTVAPGDPAPIREAGVFSLGWTAPIPWTTDPEKDRGLLRGVVRALVQSHKLPKDAVLRAARAMGVWSGDLQTYGVDPAGFAALFGLIGGQATTQVGMTYHKIDATQWAASDVVAGGAAARAGVLRGDVLVSIDGQQVAHGWKDFQYLLGAPVGTSATLVVRHATAEHSLTLTMSPVATPIVESRMIGKVGYLRVWTCTHSDNPKLDAAALAQKALAEMDRKGAKQLVLDLRGNAGGFPFDLASLFVEVETLMYALPDHGDEQAIARTKVAAWKTKRPLAILVDEGTASGAEMIALALHEHAAAVVVGRPTAGGLTFPTTEQLVGNVTLSYPTTRVATVKDKRAQPGNRIVPDLDAPNPTADDYAAHRDPQLDAAIAALKK
ncbi:S41 family peptidase [soil metagenome]